MERKFEKNLMEARFLNLFLNTKLLNMNLSDHKLWLNTTNFCLSNFKKQYKKNIQGFFTLWWFDQTP